MPVLPVPAAQVPWVWDLDWVDPVELEDEPDDEELKDFQVYFLDDFNLEDFLELDADESANSTVTGSKAADEEIFLADEEAGDEGPFPEEPFPLEEPPPAAAIINPPSPGPAIISSEEKVIMIRSGANLVRVQQMPRDYFANKIGFSWALDHRLVERILEFCKK